MRDIELPITQTYSLTIDMQSIDMSKAIDRGDGQYIVPLGELVGEKASAISEKARINGGKVLYATTSIEKQIEGVITEYFMGSFMENNDRRIMFEQEITQSSIFSYRSKKELVSKIVNNLDLLPGKKKNKLQSYLKKIMEWRNAFAHGKIHYDNLTGCFVEHYSGGLKQLILTDDYWSEVERVFNECSKLIKQATKKLVGGQGVGDK